MNIHIGGGSRVPHYDKYRAVRIINIRSPKFIKKIKFPDKTYVFVKKIQSCEVRATMPHITVMQLISYVLLAFSGVIWTFVVVDSFRK